MPVEGFLVVAAALSDSFTIYELCHFGEFAIFFGEGSLSQSVLVDLDEAVVEQFFFPGPFSPRKLPLPSFTW